MSGMTVNLGTLGCGPGPYEDDAETMDAMDLITWLRVQLDEDERVATGATAGPWRHNRDKHWKNPESFRFEEAVFAGPSGRGAICVAGTGESDDPQSMIDAEHIARWDPARVLAEVNAKRRVLDRHTMKTGERVTHGVCAECGGSDWKPGVSGAELDPFPWVMPWPCPTLKLLALPYAGRDGYREEWRP